MQWCEEVLNLVVLNESSERTAVNPCRLKGADDLEVVADEDVVRPVNADIVHLVFAVTQLHNAVDNAPG